MVKMASPVQSRVSNGSFLLVRTLLLDTDNNTSVVEFLVCISARASLCSVLDYFQKLFQAVCFRFGEWYYCMGWLLKHGTEQTIPSHSFPDSWP